MRFISRIKQHANDAALTVMADVHTQQMTAKRSRFSELTLLFVLLAMSSPVMADDFSGFRRAIEDFAGGDFAIGISVLAIVLGALWGLGKGSAQPAMFGFAIAAVFAIGPYLVVKIFEVFGNIG